MSGQGQEQCTSGQVTVVAKERCTAFMQKSETFADRLSNGLRPGISLLIQTHRYSISTHNDVSIAALSRVR
jgi:hypothetical protein